MKRILWPAVRGTVRSLWWASGGLLGGWAQGLGSQMGEESSRQREKPVSRSWGRLMLAQVSEQAETTEWKGARGQMRSALVRS